MTLPALVTALFLDEAHDLNVSTLNGLKRLREVISAGGGTLSIALVGHPRLQNDKRGDRPAARRHHLLHGLGHSIVGGADVFLPLTKQGSKLWQSVSRKDQDNRSQGK